MPAIALGQEVELASNTGPREQNVPLLWLCKANAMCAVYTVIQYTGIQCAVYT